MEDMKIGLFVPEKTKDRPLNISKLNKMTGKEFKYAAKGRYAIEHILKNLVKGDEKVLLPAYFCLSILEPLHRLNLDYELYDLDINDLNPSISSIERILERDREQIRVVIVPSFYGNPANLSEIWNVCKKYGVVMLDDAAQSFGAMLDGKFVGTFGEAGMFAFSPGKATPGHMGSFCWSESKMEWRTTRHPLYHRVCYKNYIENRVKIYEKCNVFSAVTQYFLAFLDRIFYIGNDRMEPFEEELLGGYLWDNLDLINRRRDIHEQFLERFSNQSKFRVIQACRGEANPCKIVLLFNKEEECLSLKDCMTRNGISYFGGYNFLPGKNKDIDVTKKVINHVIELPVEMNVSHMNYIGNVVEMWLETIKRG